MLDYKILGKRIKTARAKVGYTQESSGARNHADFFECYLNRSAFRCSLYGLVFPVTQTKHPIISIVISSIFISSVISSLKCSAVDELRNSRAFQPE